MLIIIIVAFLFVLFLVLGILNKWREGGLIGLTCITGAALFFIAVSFINIGRKFDLEIEEYENLRMQVEEYNSLSDSTMAVLAVKVPSLEYDIRKEVIRVNNRISQHKVMSGSIWVGPWYSEKVGSLEKLRLNAMLYED